MVLTNKIPFYFCFSILPELRHYIIKQVKAGSVPGKNINDNIIKTVRELSDKGWAPTDISRKLMIDENSIRFIINTTAL